MAHNCAMRYSSLTIALVAAVLLGVLLPPPLPAGDDDNGWEAELEAWRQRRLDGLQREDGWLSLVALTWLEPGISTLGSDPDSWVVLPEGKAPPLTARIALEDGVAWLEPVPGVALSHDGQPVSGRLELVPDSAEHGPTVVELGDLLFYAIERDGRVGIRAKDRQSPVRLGFEGIERFPADSAWRIPARFEENPPGTTLAIANVAGMLIDEPSWGTLVFEVGGESYRLAVVARPGDDSLFVIFADATTGVETYGAGRYLYTEAPDAAGRVTIDFNRAYNPPCVFTPYATCPLPPRQNHLPFRLEAGEKSWHGGDG